MPIQPKSKKMGRPVLPKGHAKSGRIQVRMSAEEQKKIAAAAKERRQTVSDFVREMLSSVLEA